MPLETKFVDEYVATQESLLRGVGVEYESKYALLPKIGVNIHYLVLGSGTPLVMVHGGGSHASEWINILKPLSEHFRLFVVDRPGCGLSEGFDYRNVDLRKHAEDFLDDFTTAVGLSRTAVLGTSMGGFFTICFALKNPERVERLILVGAPAGVHRWTPPMLRALGTRGLNWLLVHTVAKPSPSGLKRIHEQLLVADVKKLSGAYLHHCYIGQRLHSFRTGFPSLLENALNRKGWNPEYYVGDKLSQLTMPVRFVWGKNDAFESPESGKLKAAAIDDMRFETVDNAGHCPWLDQPEKTVALIIDAMKN